MADKIETRGRHLNHVAWLYDPIMERLSFGRERKFRETTMAVMAFSATDRILDIGCGTGSLTLLVAERLEPEGAIVGIDAAPKMIAIARRKATKSRGGGVASFQVGVAERLDFPDASFDMVVNSMFMHHIDTALKQASFREMHRVLRPRGKLVTADIDRPTTRLGAVIGWSARYLLLQEELADNLRGNLPQLMADAGFTDIRRQEHLYGLVSFFTAGKPGEQR